MINPANFILNNPYWFVSLCTFIALSIYFYNVFEGKMPPAGVQLWNAFMNCILITTERW